MTRWWVWSWNGPEPSPTPELTVETWLDPAFPWRAGVIIGVSIIVVTALVLLARSIQRKRVNRI